MMSNLLKEAIKEILKAEINESFGGTVDPTHEIIKIKEEIEAFAESLGKHPRSVTRQFMNDLIGKRMKVKPRYTKDIVYRRLLMRAMKLGRRRNEIFSELYDEFKRIMFDSQSQEQILNQTRIE